MTRFCKLGKEKLLILIVLGLRVIGRLCSVTEALMDSFSVLIKSFIQHIPA